MSYTKKFVASLAAAGLLTGLMVPSAFAMTNNSVDIVKSIADDATKQELGKLTLKEDSDTPSDMQPGTSFMYTLPSGVKLDDSATAIGGDVYKYVFWNGNQLSSSGNHGLTVAKSGDYTLTIKLPPAGSEYATSSGVAASDSVAIKPYVKIDGFDGGDIEANVTALDSGLSGGKYVIGRVATGQKTTASCVKVETIGDNSGSQGGIIRIEENYAGSIGAVTATSGTPLFTVKLPSNFKWVDATSTGTASGDSYVSGLGGFSGVSFTTSLDTDSRTLNVYGTLPATTTDRGIIEVNPIISPDSDAAFGDVTASIEGKVADNVDDADIVVANYADFGTTVKLVGDVENVVAGQYDTKTAKINIKENIAGSLTGNRKVRVDFPTWVKVTGIKTYTAKTTGWEAESAVKAKIDGKDSYVEINYTGAPSQTKAELEVQFYLSVKGNTDGEIKAKVSGRAGAEGELVVSKATLPVSATNDAKELRVGVKEQPLNDIIIAETDKGNIMDDKLGGSGYRELKVKLTDGVTWSAVPTVEVVEGDVDLDKDGIAKTDDDTTLTIPIKSSGTKASKIKISNVKVDLDRSVPEGTIEAKIGGNAIVENDKTATSIYYQGSEYTSYSSLPSSTSGSSTTVDSGEFDQSWAVKLAVGKVITPADQNQKRTATFKIGESKMTIGGVETVIDAAPYIKSDRTYVPLRFVAKAVGVDDNNISYNADDQSVILIKGDRVVKLQVGSSVLTINGVPMTMDVAPEVADPGRIMLPVKWVAQALGITANWDAATQTVTVN
ncbi:copper amine oxidase N-terminal domain-containing protein [Heliobacterium gestii]|uniref:Copper amine oxidase N-terminal domain-containing protein n=1 Tax=Heliomicrobium gestii TaxID=2699 RepID=A0A845LA86_HELGE|nr:copper amine oxidase N-terminal domain-containing protein [Heliomicrobium gestii]MBM7866592.1 hypothetical protein [Heliomicrobium gestii]MZP43128.1 copper amine oxidase N-terminal domain-containing protein [Heliomicrobium gestii]